MNSQNIDTILINNGEYIMYGSPLNDYWEKCMDPQQLYETNQVILKEYSADWKIVENRLFLIKFYGEFMREGKKCSMIDLFPGTRMVFANWFSGRISISIGKRVNYAKNFLEPVYELQTELIFENGMVVDSGAFVLD